MKVAPTHSQDHLKGIDILAVTPAVFYQSAGHPEVEQAKKLGLLTKWQDFLGTYLHTDKFVICIAGTHGKSTTTAMAGLLLENAGLDPTVEIGATVREWDNNVRIGLSKYFVSEADEFHDNFVTYHSDIIILTMVELDHPEYFGTIDTMLRSYQTFIDHLKPQGTVIYNTDSPLIHRLKLPKNSIPYTQSEFPKSLPLKIPGLHNQTNATAILKLADILHIPSQVTYQTLQNFTGLARRIELLGEKNGVKVYDDYANHPSSFKATIAAVKAMHPAQHLTVVIEPHTFSRLRAMLSELPDSIRLANEVIVSKIFAGRDQDPGDFTGLNIVDALHHPHAQYIAEFPDIVSYLVSHTSRNNVILVMGSGDSYKLSRLILSQLV